MRTELVAQEVQLTSIIPNPNNPRKTFDEKKLEELAATIARNGVLQPVLLRPHPTTDNAYDLVAGERRVRASLIAQKKTIPAVIRAMNDDDDAGCSLDQEQLRVESRTLDTLSYVFGSRPSER
jgi:ParB family chromosome partitioning protein